LLAVSNLSSRAASVLYAVITEFIAGGEPVGSRTLALKYGLSLSPATVRNVLADLEESGYLAQPHPSSGRVPTEKAFRLFVDVLMRIRQITSDESAKITEWLDALEPGKDILRETGKLLCELTGAPALMARPRIESRDLIRIRFIPTRPQELLTVLVFADGTVENRFIQVEREPSERELERLHNMLNDVVQGHTLSNVREHFARMCDRDRGELAALSELGLSLVSGALGSPGARSLDVLIEGQARLLDRPEFADAERVRNLMRVLEDREHLVTLLDRTQSSTRVQVFLGQQTNEMVGVPMSVVAAPYREHGDRPGGAVAVIGPTRMDYPVIVPLVGAAAEAVTSALARRGEASQSSAERRRGRPAREAEEPEP
jgi:heat-inducible transcriptional repressor